MDSRIWVGSVAKPILKIEKQKGAVSGLLAQVILEGSYTNALIAYVVASALALVYFITCIPNQSQIMVFLPKIF